MNPPAERLKELAGRRAADYVEGGMCVGLGSGSTIRYTIIALGERELDITCVASSEETAARAAEVGLRVVAPDAVHHLDVGIDGADEVDPRFNLVKGGGGAHAREKVLAAMAERFIVVVDESKLVPALGAFGLPVEALTFAPEVVSASLMELGAAQVTRRPTLSDNGNVLLDAAFGAIAEPATLARRLASVPGLVDHGLFLADMVERVVVAGANGTRELIRPHDD